MIFETLFLLALTCPTVKMTNTSGFPWNAFDKQTAERAHKRCAHHFPNSPCLVKFQKHAERDYRALCGAKR